MWVQNRGNGRRRKPVRPRETTFEHQTKGYTKLSTQKIPFLHSTATAALKITNRGKP
jgi:hypothetical protein